MNIEYVNVVNLSLLEDAFNSGIKNTKDITKNFGKNLPLLLSHIKFSFVISEISIFEAYMLKRFSNGNYIDIETYMDDNKVDRSKYPEAHRAMQSIFLLNRTINADTDVEVKPGVLLFPAKCIEKKCIVTFQGQEILSILGAIVRGPECFFVKVESSLRNNPDRSKSDVINDLLIECFLKEFYSYVSYRVEYIDLLTDSVLDFTYLQSIRENEQNLISLSHINTIYGDIPFIGIDANMYNDSINKLSQNKVQLNLPDSNIMMDSAEIFFTCNTSWYTFLEAFLYLPIGSVLESTDIKIIYSSEQFILPKELMKYQSRISSIIEKMKTERLSVEKNKNIDNYNIIPLNIRMQYSIKFKLSEISNILMTWEDLIVNKHIYGDSNNYLTREIIKVISMMKNYAIAAYKTITK